MDRMNIYTRTGDEGLTALKGGRVAKDHIRVHTYGELDELNAFTAVAHAACDDDRLQGLREQLLQIQHELFDCGSDLAFADESQGKAVFKVTPDMVTNLEKWIDQHEADNAPLTRFILPGGHPAAAALHVCRTVCRRAERSIVTLSHQESIHQEVLKYVNRLSDYFFTAARRVNGLTAVEDVEYERSAHVFRSGVKKGQHE